METGLRSPSGDFDFVRRCCPVHWVWTDKGRQLSEAEFFFMPGLETVFTQNKMRFSTHMNFTKRNWNEDRVLIADLGIAMNKFFQANVPLALSRFVNVRVVSTHAWLIGKHGLGIGLDWLAFQFPTYATIMHQLGHTRPHPSNTNRLTACRAACPEGLTRKS